MTDVLPRLDGAFDGSDRRTLDRRQLLKAGAWAAPVLVLATASPAMANATSGGGSGGETPTKAPTFSDYFVWNAGNPANNYGAIQIADSTLVNKTGRDLLAVTATLSVSPNPGVGVTWRPQWDQPRAASWGGWTTRPFNMPSFVSTPQRLQFQAARSDWQKIANGTYTMTVTLTWTENGQTISVSEGRSVTIA